MGYWVFGYASLIWKPGFDYVRREPALLRGAHRQLCLYSHRYRGTPETPGLVMGLEQGGTCRGVAFEVAPEKWDAVYAYLVEREARGDAYRESWRSVELGSGEKVKALAFMVNRKAPNYAGRLPREELLRFVRQGTGTMGHNAEYVIETARHLSELGFSDELLDWLSAELRRGKN